MSVAVHLGSNTRLRLPDMRILVEESLTEMIPTALHELAFVPFIRSQATPKQAQKWLPLADQYVSSHPLCFH